MNFSDIIGQSTVKTLLRASIEKNKVGHAYIFEGEDGIGRRTMAKAFASSLMCVQDNVDACEVCKSCIMIENDSHPDMLSIKLLEDEKSIGVDIVRNILRDIYTKPFISNKKIVIFQNADLITEQAQNALLKALEEPPHYLVFILIANNAQKLLETIRSRAITVKFVPYSLEEIKQAMIKNNLAYSEFIIKYSNNNIGHAIRLCCDDRFKELREKLFLNINCMFEDRLEIYKLAQFFLDNSENVDILTDCMLSIFRDIELIKLNCKQVMENTDKLVLLKKYAEKMEQGSVLEIIQNILNMKQRLSQNVNYSLAVMTLLHGSWEAKNG